MGKLNTYNYYSIQILETAKPVIDKMLGEKCRLKTIYKFLRNEARWLAFGDYPLVYSICQIAKEKDRIVGRKELFSLLKNAQDGEFKALPNNSKFLKQLCACLNEDLATVAQEKQEADQMVVGKGKHAPR